MKDIKSFPKIFTAGSTYIPDLFKGEVVIEEKVDGSQIKWGVNENGEIVIASKGAKIEPLNPPKMFKKAVDHILDKTEVLLGFGKEIYFYGEFLDNPKHNILKYNNVPKNHIVLFGIAFGDKIENNRELLKECANKLDIDIIPELYRGEIASPTDIENFMKQESYLGGAIIEGVVIKNYGQVIFVANFPWPSFGKYVREDFKEQLKDGWSKEHTSGGKLQTYILSFRAEPRWQKSIQHLAEKNELTYEAKDIGRLMKEVGDDIEVEEKENIKNFLYKLYIGDIRRTAIKGLPEYYKKYLLEKSFENGK